jgi:predicted RNase H-like HicB family nuclease
MHYTVVLEPTEEAEHPGWYYAHIPVLDLTTHGEGIEGALAAARDLVEGWIAQLEQDGKPVPVEANVVVGHIEVKPDAVQTSGHSGAA